MGYCLKANILLSLFLTLITMGLNSETSEMRDYCDKDTFQAHCERSEVVLMQEALFGRMELGTCLTIDFLLGCFRDVLLYMDRWCSGRMSCDVPVMDLQFLTNPCTDDMRSYLQASFTCIPVVKHGDSCCQFGNDHAEVGADNGCLASSVALDTGCGSRDCPWQIEALEGRRINISIYDFGLYDIIDQNTESAHIAGHCVLYATIKELAIGTSVRVCGGGKRKRHVYTSKTNSVEIEIHFDEQNGEDMDVYHSHFVLEYEVLGHLPTGCADPPIPAHAVLNREGDHATLSCPGPSDVSWEITCYNGEWHGTYGNCSTGASGNGDTVKITNDSKGIQFGPRMVVIIIVAVAVILAIAIVIIGVVCVLSARRSANLRYAKRIQSPVYESRVKGYDEFQFEERENWIAGEHTGIRHYLRDWDKHNPPYISSPTLLTGTFMGANMDCDGGDDQKLPFRDRSLSAGSKELPRCNPVPTSATYAEDRRTDRDYKTHES